jgi:hypothetical protein
MEASGETYEFKLFAKTIPLVIGILKIRKRIYFNKRPLNENRTDAILGELFALLTSKMFDQRPKSGVDSSIRDICDKFIES